MQKNLPRTKNTRSATSTRIEAAISIAIKIIFTKLSYFSKLTKFVCNNEFLLLSLCVMCTETNWIVKNTADTEAVARLASEVGIDVTLAQLLVQRGVKDFESARAFFNPSLENIHDPFLMKDMDKAVDRLCRAIDAKERILVYGDYDVDGTSAVALVVSFLRKFSTNIDYYIPDRYNDGYGVSFKAIDKAFDDGVNLIITLDCGIKAVAKVDYAKSKGIDMIICDHHLPEDTIPAAVAVLDPKREDCNYPFDDLCGCGVGFKLVQGFAKRRNVPFETLMPLFDLLVVSIAADLVNVTDENRVLAHFGLKRLNENPRKGLEAMMKLAALEQGHVTIDDIVFKIGPRINAAGRMETGDLAVKLLLAGDKVSAMEYANQINESNNQRKDIDRETTAAAIEMVNSGTAILNDNLIIVYNKNWHKGVVGIVASRLVETFYRPAIVFTMAGGMISGSARSIQGLDLYTAIDSCADILENFGGHLYAAGITIRPENLDEFVRRINAKVGSASPEKDAKKPIEADIKLDFSKITPKFFRILRRFQPFGPGNPSPVFITEEVYDNGNSRKVGAGAAHLKLDLIQEKQPYNVISAIAFNQATLYDYIHAGNPIDVCYSIVENIYRGTSSLQLRIKDIKKYKEDIF